MTNKCFTIGITGGSGSGKTSFAKLLVERLQPFASLILLDNYYHPIQLQPLDHLGKPNFDQPHSLDLERFYKDLVGLQNGQRVAADEYTFNNPNIIPKKLTIEPNKILVTEGLYVFQEPEIRSLYDLKIFIEAEEEIKLNRRLERDTKERGYNEEEVMYSHIHHVTPSYHKYVEQHKKEAHILIPNNTDFLLGLEIIEHFLKRKLDLNLI